MNPKIEKVLKYLNTLDVDAFDWSVRDKLYVYVTANGFTKIGEGSSSRVFKCGKYVLKLGSDNFNKLRPLMNEWFFKQYAPTIHWIHTTGYALLCDYVPVMQVPTNNFYKYSQGWKRKVIAAGYAGYDLHEDNLMKNRKTGRVIIVDYGCFAEI